MRPGDGEYRAGSNGAGDDVGYGLEEVSTSGLVSELVGEAQRMVTETQHLLREEVRLAKEELKQDVAATGRAAGLFGAAGVIGHAAVLSFAAAAIFALALVIPAWAAALVVGVFLVALGAVLGFAGKSTLSRVQFFDETAEQVKEDSRWASETMRNARSKNRVNA